MTGARQCDYCGSQLRGRTPEGLCPACLLGAGLGDDGGEAEDALDPPPIAEQPGDTLGQFLLHEQIGEGGFGVVFRAEQLAPVRRMVALKVIKPGMDSKEVIARFEAERQALALMDHPCIAKVYDAGTTGNGRPFFVMELVHGKPLGTYCDERRLDIEQRLALFAEICDAVQHAHQKGVIHRDLKPSNLLVCDAADDKPLPKIIDFGVAKAISIELTERTYFTIFGGLVGTPQYMSPEQATLNAVDVDTRSDIYSLGVALYELVTGVAPLEKEELTAADFDGMRRLIREKEPLIPSARLCGLTPELLQRVALARKSDPAKIRRQITGDLDWIIMKALDKDPDRRYATAQSFALDLRRYLDDLPVLAGPPGAAYRVAKFVTRHRGAVAVGALALLALIGVSIGALKASSQLRKAATVAEFEHLQMLLERVQNSKDGDPGSKAQGLRDLREIGEKTDPEAAGWMLEGIDPATVGKLRSGARDQLIDTLAWTDLTEERFFEHREEIVRAAFDDDHQHFVVALGDGRIQIYDAAGGLVAERAAPTVPFSGPLQFSPNGDVVAAGQGSEGSWQLGIWNWREDRWIELGKKVSGVNAAFDFRPAGGGFAVGTGRGTLEVFSGEGERQYEPLDLRGKAEALRFSPDGNWIAVTIADGEVPARLLVIDLAGQEVFADRGGFLGKSLAWAPHQRAVLAGGSDGSVIVFEPVENRSFVLAPNEDRGHSDEVYQVAWSHDGTLAASGSRDGTIQLWNVPHRQSIRSFDAWAERLSFADNDESVGPVAPVSSAGCLSTLVIDKASTCRFAAGHPGEDIVAAAWNGNGTVLATAARDGLKLWNREGKELMPGAFSGVTVRPGGVVFSSSHLYTSEAGSISRREVSVIDGHLEVGPVMELLSGFSNAEQIVLTPDEQSLVIALDGGVELLDLASRRRVEFKDCPPATTRLAISPDGKWLAAGSGVVADARVWATDAPKRSYPLKVAGPPAVAFYPLKAAPQSGAAIPPHLVTGDSEAYRIWTEHAGHWSTDEQKAIPSKMPSRGGHRPHMVFNPRGTSLSISFERKLLKVLRPKGRDLTDWQMMTKPGFDSQSPLVISRPGGRLLATEDDEGGLHLWDLDEVAKEIDAHELAWPQPVPAFAAEPPPLVKPRYGAEKREIR